MLLIKFIYVYLWYGRCIVSHFQHFNFARIAASNSSGHFGINYRIKAEERKLPGSYVDQLSFD
jgi:hypothetical protein